MKYVLMMFAVMLSSICYAKDVRTAPSMSKPGTKISLPVRSLDSAGTMLWADFDNTDFIYYDHSNPAVSGSTLRYAVRVFCEKSNINRIITKDTVLLVDYVVENKDSYSVFCHSAKNKTRFEIKIRLFDIHRVSSDLTDPHNNIHVYFKPKKEDIDNFFRPSDPVVYLEEVK